MAKNCKPNIIIPDKYSVVVVQNITERNHISCKIRQNGMIAVVVEENYAQYQIRTKEGLYSVCNNNAWVKISTGDKVLDGSNLIILNDEKHKQEYLQSGLAVKGQMIVNGYLPSDMFKRVACNCNGVINFFGDFKRASNIIGYQYQPRDGYNNPTQIGKVFTQPNITSPVVAAGEYVTNIKDVGGGYYEVTTVQIDSEGKAYNYTNTEVHANEIGTTYPVYDCGVANTPTC